MTYRARTAGIYIFKEMLPSFILGNVVFIFILLMFQVLRLSEFIIVHGVSFSVVAKLTTFMTISFLPACIPISLLFSILLTFGRLSSDSEIIAFKSVGLTSGHLLVPAMTLATIVAIISGYVSFFGGPWGNRGFEVLITKLASSKAASKIQSGTFAEGFYDLVLYAGDVDSKTGTLNKVFIFDEREPENPITIISRTGHMLQPKGQGGGVTLRLSDGNIHRTQKETYTKIDYQKYDISLSNPALYGTREKSPQSYDYYDLRGRNNPAVNPKKRRELDLEFHKRLALVAACLVFGVLGVGAGTTTNRRTVKASGLVISLGIMVIYWVLYLTGDTLAKNGTLPPWFAMWVANFIFMGVGIWSVKQVW